jgi:uncharacterized protein
MRSISKAVLLLTLMIFAGFANAEVDPELLEQATQGHAKAQFNLGGMYDYGIGVPEDDKQAVKWFRLAAEQGYADAQNNLGVMYAKGEGVPEDFVLAYMWVNLAGANGYDVSKAKEMLASRMTQADISKAQERTRQYIKDNPDVF